MRRVVAVFLAVAVIPACSDDHGGGGSAALFSDDFNRSAAGPDWHVETDNGSAGIDPTQGSPQPALALSVSQGDSSAAVHSEMTFSARPLTVIADLHPVSIGETSGGMEIVNASHVPLASAERSAAAGEDMTFKIGGATQTVDVSSSPSAFERVTFSVDASGNASWSLGDTVVMTQTGFPTTPVSVRLFTRAGTVLPGSAFPVFLFDNVRVTSP